MATAKKNTPAPETNDSDLDLDALLANPKFLDIVSRMTDLAQATVPVQAPVQAPVQVQAQINPERMIAHAVNMVDERISDALSTKSIGAALEAYEASKDTAWYESKWVIGGAALVAAGAVGYGIYRANKRAGQALETAGAAANTLKAFGPVAGDDGVITLTNCRMGS